MSNLQKELAIFKKFDFEIPPVGVKFLVTKPEGIKKLDQILDFCEMLAEAQQGQVFYAASDNFTCVGPLLLGMVESEPVFESGMVGPELEIFRDARANKRLYHLFPDWIRAPSTTSLSPLWISSLSSRMCWSLPPRRSRPRLY